MKYPSDVIEGWIERCEEDIEAGNPKFTKKDVEFIESISDQFDRKGFLTDGQIEVLERIYARNTD